MWSSNCLLLIIASEIIIGSASIFISLQGKEVLGPWTLPLSQLALGRREKVCLLPPVLPPPWSVTGWSGGVYILAVSLLFRVCVLIFVWEFSPAGTNSRSSTLVLTDWHALSNRLKWPRIHDARRVLHVGAGICGPTHPSGCAWMSRVHHHDESCLLVLCLLPRGPFLCPPFAGASMDVYLGEWDWGAWLTSSLPVTDSCSTAFESLGSSSWA